MKQNSLDMAIPYLVDGIFSIDGTNRLSCYNMNCTKCIFCVSKGPCILVKNDTLTATQLATLHTTHPEIFL